MVNRVAGCQPPATPLLRFGLPSPPGVVGMVMAPGSASRKHPFCVVCVWPWLSRVGCGVGVGVGVWGCGPLVVPCVRALFVGGSGCAWVGCPCGGSSTHPGRWVLGLCQCLRRVLWLSAAIAVVHCSALLCCVVCCAAFTVLCGSPLSALLCRIVLCAAQHQQGMAATATGATATLFYGGQGLGPGCRHTRVQASGAHQCDLGAVIICAPLPALCAWALRCPVLLWCVLLYSVVRLCGSWRAALHCVLCCVLSCIHKEWRPRLHGHGHTLPWGPRPGNLRST